jgi:hypothetical protein
MVRSDSYHEQLRWKGWVFVLLIVVVSVLLLKFLG